MPWSEAMTPVRMQRVAIVAPHASLREALVLVADAGCVEIDRTDGPGRGARGAALRLRRLRTEPAEAALSAAAPDLAVLEREGRAELLAGEAQLEERVDSAVVRGATAALAGWCPADQVPRLAERLADAGGVLVPLKTPRGVAPPTLLHATGAPGRSFTRLVTAYGTVPYPDIDPSWPAGIVYVVMFGVMFGDAGHGLLLLLAALLLYLRRPRHLAPLHTAWPFVAGAVRTATEPLPGNTALAHAEQAYQEAVRAAAEYAVARTAARLVGTEVARTRQRCGRCAATGSPG